MGKILKPRDYGSGYFTVKLYADGVVEEPFVHYLVAAAFIGPCPEGKEVNHKDLNHYNNKYSNLEYLTHAGNIQHAVRNRTTWGWSHRCKLTQEQKTEIRRLYSESKRTYSDRIPLAEKFAVSEQSIQNVLY